MRTLASLALLLIGCSNATTMNTTGDAGGNVDGGGPGPGHDLAGNPPPGCVPACASKSCGDDGCGGVCGSCPADQLCSAGACAAPSGSAQLTVDATSNVHAIHPEVYGLAFADPSLLKALNVPLNRWGGNSTTLYNWQLDVQNLANDWYFENTANVGSGTYGQAGYVSSSDKFVQDNAGANAATLMTIPTIGWTPKDRVPDHPFTCGFPIEKYPNQQSTDPYDAHCGNGKDSSGNPIVGDPSNDAMAAPPSFEGQWVQHMVSTFGMGGVHYYQLDNEMMLWDSTHQDVWKTPVSSDDVWNATLNYAPAIKAADPMALVLGYVAWSPMDILISGVDSANGNHNDQMAHGGIPLGQWYLQQLATYEKQNGKRIVDCFDMHYYPQGGDALDTTRSLWDPTYTDPSWYNDVYQEPIQLFPRIQGWINQEYPGTGICISEYNFNLNDQNNAEAGLVEADLLGLYGKYGVRLAAYWTTPVDGNGNPQPPYRAFQIFRNYDGANGRFADWSVGAASTLPKVAIYAAADAQTSAGKLTIIIINKETQATNATLGLQNFNATGSAQLWQVLQNAAPAKQADVTISANQLSLSLPASSISLLVVGQ